MSLDELLPALPAVPLANTEVTWFDTDTKKFASGRPGHLEHAGIIGFFRPAGQAVTFRVKHAPVVGDDTKLVTVAEQTAASNTVFDVLVAFGGARTVVTLATGGTPPSAWAGGGRLTSQSVL